MDASKNAFSEDEMRVMLAFRGKPQRDEANRLRKAYQDVVAEGLAEGRRRVARKMVASGVDPQVITSALDLQPEHLA